MHTASCIADQRTEAARVAGTVAELVVLFFAALVGCTTHPKPTAPTESAADAGSAGQEPSHLDADAIAGELDSHIATFGAQWGEAFAFSGFVLVGHAGDPIYARGFGYANRERRVPNDIDTSFCAASVTKQFTAAAILKLQEQGKLSVGDTIRTHLPEYPASGDKITIAHLLSHTAGIPSYTDDHDLDETRPRTVRELLSLFWDRPLDFEPGHAWSYSNSGYAVLGAIIESASGMSYGEYLHFAILEPAGLTRTRYGDAAELRNRALGYEVTQEETIEPAVSIDPSTPFAAGGVRSTARDLLRWHEVLEADAVLTPESRQQLYTPVHGTYAYGWEVRDYYGHRLVEHGGTMAGFHVLYRRFLDDDIVVLVWSNAWSDVSRNVPLEVSEAATLAALGRTVPPHHETPVASVSAAEQRRYVGHYVLTDASLAASREHGVPQAELEKFASLRVTAVDGALWVGVGDGTTRLHRERGDRFFTKRQGRPLQFDGNDKEGRATELSFADTDFIRYERDGAE